MKITCRLSDVINLQGVGVVAGNGTEKDSCADNRGRSRPGPARWWEGWGWLIPRDDVMKRKKKHTRVDKYRHSDEDKRRHYPPVCLHRNYLFIYELIMLETTGLHMKTHNILHFFIYTVFLLHFYNSLCNILLTLQRRNFLNSSPHS